LQITKEIATNLKLKLDLWDAPLVQEEKYQGKGNP
jgi:hypothetical protein